MSNWVQGVLSTHAQGLLTYSRRAEVLASNLANADTPGYKARDVDFRAVLGAARDGAQVRTNPRHMASGIGGSGAALLYRYPQQPSLDGNTVEAPIEQAAFADNAMRYQASLRFLDGSVKSLLLAIKGE